jgi:hypothetical protein
MEHTTSGPDPDEENEAPPAKDEPSFEESMQRLRAAAHIFATGAIRAVRAAQGRREYGEAC